MTVIHLVTASDENYLTGVAAQIASAAANLADGHVLHAHVIGYDLPAAKVAALRSAVMPVGLRLDVVAADPHRSRGLPLNRPGLHLATYGRLLIPELLPQLDRVIYGDCDTIVHCDLSELWRMITPDKVMLAVREGCCGDGLSHWRRLGINPQAPYFNAGVIGMNLNALRERGDMEKCLELARDPSLSFPQNDQDVLNAVLHDSVHFIPSRWNSLTMLTEDRVSLLPWRACIIHTIWKAKPWLFERKGSHGLVKLFYDYLALTEWPEEYIPRPRFKQTAPLWRIALEKARLRIAMARGRVQTAN